MDAPNKGKIDRFCEDKTVITNRKMILVLMVASVVSAIFFMVRPSISAAAPPNIVMVLTDDQRLEDIEHMPILQRLLVREGMSFQNFFSNVSLCCPSRTSILRGQFAHNTAIYTNGGAHGGYASAHKRGLEDSTVGVWLHEHGYRTALIGKYLNHYPQSVGETYVPPGWDYWASAVKGNPYSEYNYTLNENGKLVEYGEKPEDYGTDVYVNKATAFMAEAAAKHKPFFVYLAVYAPHSPATPAPRHMEMFQTEKIPRTPAFNETDVSAKPQFVRDQALLTPSEIASADAYYRKRLRSLQSVDEAIRTIYDTLKKSKQLDNIHISSSSLIMDFTWASIVYAEANKLPMKPTCTCRSSYGARVSGMGRKRPSSLATSI